MKSIPLKFHGPEFDQAAAEFKMQGGADVQAVCTQIHQGWREQAAEAVRRALLETERTGDFDVSTLTEDEKFAIGYMAEVPIEVEQHPLKWRTVPCGIIWTGKGFQVLIAPQSED